MVHRKLPFAEIYFLANTSNHPVNQIVRLRSCLREAIWLDPSSGRPVEADYNVGWAPYESRVLVCSGFSARPAPPGSDMAPMDLSRDWKVTFADSKEPLTMAALRSW